MKLNLISLVISVAAAAPMHTLVAQATPNQVAQPYPALKGIGLTETQQGKIQMIRKDAIAQITKILTPEQSATLSNAIGNNADLRTAISELNLSNDQKSQIQPILYSSYQQVESELTPSQRKQMQQNVRALIMQRFR